MSLKPNSELAKTVLKAFIQKGLKGYSKLRNFDYGPNDRSNVSNLSPYIKRRIIHEKDVIKQCLESFGYTRIEKFIQEVFWRTYWKGWLEGRKQVWNDYLDNVAYLKNSYSNTAYFNAVNASTGIECFDSWTNELKKNGYLHNHTRMWYASIWIFTLNLPWELGSDFFYRNLLDADAASNTLSWRWVAGLHTSGKFYLAKHENIEKFSKFKFNDLRPLNTRASIPEYIFYEYTKPTYKAESWDDIEFFLINPNNLLYDEKVLYYLKNAKVIFLNCFIHSQDSEHKKVFNSLVIKEYLKWLKNNKLDVVELSEEIELIKFLKKRNSSIHTPYPAVGYEKDKIELISKSYNLKLKYLYDPFDLMCWPHSKSGFFKFKKNIESIIKQIQNS